MSPNSVPVGSSVSCDRQRFFSRWSWAKLLVFLLLCSVVVFFQWGEGAYRSEFGGHPDEAAHYVTGLFVRDAAVFAKDYAFSGFRGSPVKVFGNFVQSYHEHYPKIGLGVWPPFFYVIQGCWTLPFGVSHASLMVLMACIAGLVGVVLYSTLQEEFGPGLALTGSLLWVGLPLVQQYAGMTMAEMLSALTMFAATLRFGRYADERKFGDAMGFGLLASCAILTKGTGLALILVPPFCIFATRRFSLLKERALWLAGGIVLILAGPWTFATRKLGEGGWEEPHPSLNFTIHALPYYGWKLAVACGVLLAGLAVWGIVCGASGTRRGDKLHFGKWASCLALIIGVVVFQSIAPVGREARHLIPALPAVLMFAVAGMGWLKQRIAVLAGCNAATGLVCGVVLLAFVGIPMINAGPGAAFGSIGDSFRFSPFRLCNKDSRGFGPIAARLMSMDANGAGKSMLISSDATGEGMFIAEVALRESHRPTHLVKRASKELATSAWGGGGYQAKYQSDEDLMGWLGSGAVGFVVVDTAIPERNRRPHHLMLQRVIDAHPERFERVASEPLFRGGEAMRGEVQAFRVR